MPEEIMGGAEGAEAVRVRGFLPRKRRVNLAYVTRTRFPWGRVLLSVAGTLALCFFFVRYAVFARFDALHDAQKSLASAQAQFDAAEETLNAYYESRDVYVHITWSDMTAEEIGLVDPADIANLLERVVLPVSPLDGWSLSKNSVTLKVYTNTLEDANELARRLREEPMVQYCSVRNGGRGSSAEGGVTEVSSEITIQFHSADNRNVGAAQ